MIVTFSWPLRQVPPPRCATCAHFDNRPATVESALPGLNSFGSADSAVRATDGICGRTSRYLSSDRWCDHHVARDA
jgi:hypothetical protein